MSLKDLFNQDRFEKTRFGRTLSGHGPFWKGLSGRGLFSRDLFSRKSLQFKLFAYFISLILLLSLTFGVMANVVYTRFIEEQANTHTEQMIDQVNKSIESYIISSERIIKRLSEDQTVLHFLTSETAVYVDDIARIRPELDGLAQIHPEISGFMLVSSSNQYIGMNMEPISRNPLTSENWYRTAVAVPDRLNLISNPIGRNVKTSYYYGVDEIVSINRAVRDPATGAIVGVIVIDMSLDIIRQAVEGIRFDRSGFVFVVDSAGSVVYAPVNDTVYRVKPSWLSGGGSGRLIRKIRGSDFSIIYSESLYTHWTTVGVFSLPEVLTIVRNVQTYSVIAGLLASLVALFMAYLYTRSIVRPLRKLRSLMRQAEGGDLKVAFNARYQDEIGQLGESFNHMIARIQELIGLVYLEQKSKREAELKTLQAQIKPHFLYNTLDTIQWLAYQKGAEDIVGIVGALSTLFRIGISRGREEITVREEIEHLRSYLVIQKARYGAKLSYEIEADESVLDLRVIKLILQPLVENAIYHGIKERRGSGHIHVTIRPEAGQLVLTVTDDGVGMTAERVQALTASLQAGAAGDPAGQPSPDPAAAAMTPGDPAASSGAMGSREAAAAGSGASGSGAVKPVGYGIRNVHERIRLAHGSEYGVSIVSSPGVGTTATIRYPLVQT